MPKESCLLQQQVIYAYYAVYFRLHQFVSCAPKVKYLQQVSVWTQNRMKDHEKGSLPNLQDAGACISWPPEDAASLTCFSSFP